MNGSPCEHQQRQSKTCWKPMRKSHGVVWMSVPVKTATVLDSNPDVKAHMHTSRYIVHKHTLNTRILLDQSSYIQMRENEMRWKSKDQIKPSTVSVGQSALSSVSMTWSPAKCNPAKQQPSTPSHYFNIFIPAEVALRFITVFKKNPT